MERHVRIGTQLSQSYSADILTSQDHSQEDDALAVLSNASTLADLGQERRSCSPADVLWRLDHALLVANLGAVDRARRGKSNEGEAVTRGESRLKGLVGVRVDVDVWEEGVEERAGRFDKAVGELRGNADRVTDEESRHTEGQDCQPCKSFEL